jgi:hypothetical protein
MKYIWENTYHHSQNMIYHHLHSKLVHYSNIRWRVRTVQDKQTHLNSAWVWRMDLATPIIPHFLYTSRLRSQIIFTSIVMQDKPLFLVLPLGTRGCCLHVMTELSAYQNPIWWRWIPSGFMWHLRIVHWQLFYFVSCICLSVDVGVGVGVLHFRLRPFAVMKIIKVIFSSCRWVHIYVNSTLHLTTVT